MYGRDDKLGGSQYVYLDFLRFVAAMLVMAYHFSTANYVEESWSLGTKAAIGTGAADYRALIPVFSTGWVGVDVFFVISGFVIAMSADGRSLKDFVQGRLLRLYPVVFITTAISLAISLMYSDEYFSDLLILSLKQILFFPKGPWIDGVFWTLIVEAAFYTATGLIIYLNRYERIERITAIWGWATCAWALAVLLAYLFGSPALNGVYRFGVSYLARIMLISTGPYFAFGILIYIVAKRGITLARGAMLSACFLASLVNIYLAASDEQFFRQGYTSATVPMTLWAIAVAGIACAAWSRLSSPGGRRIQRLARRVGLMTFPLYLIHNTFGAYMLGLLIRAGMPAYPAFCAAVILALAASYVISKSLEPVLKSVIRRYVFPTYERWCLRAAFH